MKTKRIATLLAVVLFMAAFLMPVAVYATEQPDVTQEADVGDNADMGDTAESGVADETDELPDGLIMDSDIGLELFLGLMQMAVLGEPTDADEGKPFTPDGQATVVDLAYEGDGKMFYAFATPAGNVFYLVIDRERNTDNVYFLNAVSEQDLLALTEDADKNSSKRTSTSAIPTPDPIESAPEGEGEETTMPAPEAKNPPAIEGSNTGMTAFLIIGAVAFGGAAYYIRIVRPKQQSGLDEDDDESMDEDGDGEEMEFEDELVDSDADEDEYDDETEVAE